ncbi:MAG TPA: 16S rRNA (cytosine(967)-C(5))-methyltransferase RsmB [Acidimicrobiia bacterium]|nr:16S rRNA (cytosine(967)-C(5))-methyltransferase RsmB [Acidimicrobiia bacterium]
MKPTVRRLARDALVRIEGGAYSHLALPAMLRESHLSARDRAQVTDLVYRTLRGQRRLDDLIGRASTRRIARMDPPVRAALRLGAHQLLSGVPPHAAVGETVSAAPARAQGFVNGVLRALTRLGPPWPEPESEAVALSYPDWLADRLRADLGPERATAVMVAGNEPGALTLRPNPGRTEVDALEAALREAGAEVERGRLVPSALVVRGGGDPARLLPVADGRATPQDQGSQAVVAYLDPQPGDRVLDIAAAPGGKATGIAERVGREGRVLALDRNAGRLGLVGRASSRLGLDTVDLLVADGRHLPVDGAAFDRVLLDAPCSGMGVLARRAESRWRLEPDSISELAGLQRDLLLEAARAVRPGGVLVYSVCTLTAEETRAVVDATVARRPDLVPMAPPAPPWEPSGSGALLLPQAAGTDGMYVAGLRRAAG